MWSYDLYICAAAEDAVWATQMGAQISGYRLPRNVALPADNTLGYRKIYIDTECRPFDDETATLLDACRYMMVICSPRAKDSQPILDRLLYFENTRAKANIIAVIVEGEPVDSFPPFFIEEKPVAHILPDGSIEERLEIIEPVASDLRGENKKHVRRLIRYETVRIVASVLGMIPDALEQRHNRRRKQRIAALAIFTSTVLLTVSAVFAYFGIRAYNEGQIAQQQAQQSLTVSRRLINELPAEFSDDPLALEYVNDTILDAVYALYETGSTSLSGINAEEILKITAGDSAYTILRKAALLRIALKSEGAINAYRAAAEAMGYSSEQLTVFLNSMSILCAGEYGFGIYTGNDCGGIRQGDIIITLDDESVWNPAQWQQAVSELITAETSVTVLRPDASRTAFVEQRIQVDTSELSLLSVLGV